MQFVFRLLIRMYLTKDLSDIEQRITIQGKTSLTQNISYIASFSCSLIDALNCVEVLNLIAEH
jgi:hypothetical protein